MKYGLAFANLAALIAIVAIGKGGWCYLLLWPALSFALVAVAYFGAGVVVFGKRPNGKLAGCRAILLAPFLAYLTVVWHVVRYFSREEAFHSLTETVFVGRRLLSHERPSSFDHIVDLTCEFNEPRRMRSSGYLAFPILDGHYPAAEALRQMAARVAQFDGVIYIHCAQGHGRTATFAIAWLLHQGICQSVDDAENYVLQRRPAAHLNPAQRAMLRSLYDAA
ncbi:dual specificity protein phosphatase family protein [Lignipirellula cremea]|uniref:Tyrosine specific protein phosphatases domain-containing protein n=1 Tax=Lignipirellula cremea TaxID=2528010 RepID=A0A518DXC5_9BACT|nr:dual specificity protein phosphatase family protein [Lignipirellula cremea]QDU96489.1 hypothetical protein Pla8534_43100 [Lignipirellula cremea]